MHGWLAINGSDTAKSGLTVSVLCNMRSLVEIFQIIYVSLDIEPQLRKQEENYTWKIACSMENWKWLLLRFTRLCVSGPCTLLIVYIKCRIISNINIE